MKARCPEWEIEMSKRDFDAVPQKVDLKDRHVAAAALALRHWSDHEQSAESGDACDVVLMTDNVRDMAKAQMQRLGVRVVRPGPFLDDASLAEPAATARAIKRSADELKKPPRTLAELLEILRTAGAKKLATRMSGQSGIAGISDLKLRSDR